MERWIRLAISGLLVVLALSGPALAADKKKLDPDEAKARALFKQGQTAYDLGKFDEALTLYSDAYKLKPLPGFLFNLAQCHRQLGNFKEAGFFYGRFLDNTNPTAPNVELARELLEDMKRRQAEKDELDKKAEEARLAEEKRKADEAAKSDAPLATNLAPQLLVAPPPPPPVEPEPPLYKKGWFWGVVAGGVVAVAAGTAAAIVVSRRRAAQLPQTSLTDINGR